MFDNSYKIRVSARAIILRENKILLNCFGDGVYYNFPGGGIEQGENALQTVVREVREETGLIVAAEEFVFALEYEPVTSGYIYGVGHHISLFFRCELVEGESPVPYEAEINPDDPTMASRQVWVPVERLPEINVIPQIGRNLQSYIETGVFEPLYYKGL